LVQESDVYAGDPDPHLWMDPTLAAGYVENVRDALGRLRPDQAVGMRRGAAAYLEMASLARVGTGDRARGQCPAS
jgi:ABC-type Zn uptake system ZnuABC Zn-binding protein ZnuA